MCNIDGMTTVDVYCVYAGLPRNGGRWWADRVGWMEDRLKYSAQGSVFSVYSHNSLTDILQENLGNSAGCLVTFFLHFFWNRTIGDNRNGSIGDYGADVYSLNALKSHCPLSKCRSKQYVLHSWVDIFINGLRWLEDGWWNWTSIVSYFCPVVSSSIYLTSFFPRLFSTVADWMSTILPHMMWP